MERYARVGKKREIDGLSTSAIHKEREALFNFSDIYVTSQRILIVSNLNPKNITSTKDLKNKKIGYQRKNLFDQKLVAQYKESTPVPLESFSEIIDALIKGEIDATIGSHAIIYYSLKQGLPYIKTVDKIPNSQLNLVFSIRKDYPEALSILNKGLASIPYNQKLQLHNKWFFELDKAKNRIIQSIADSTSLLTTIEKEYLNTKEKINICVLPDWLPFEQIDDKGEHHGIGNDLLQIISQKLNKEFELIQTKEWSQSLQNIRDRNVISCLLR